jgi:hypothetical protein
MGQPVRRRAPGDEHLWLGVWERNPRAIVLHEAGFRDVGSTVPGRADRQMTVLIGP